MTAARIAVVGAGAWGQALALHAHAQGHRCTLWARRPDAVRDADGGSHRLPGIALPDGIAVSDALPRDADIVLLAVPVQHLRSVLARLEGEAPLVLCCKGIEVASGSLPLALAGALQPGRAAAVLSGPNFAGEIAAGLPAAGIVAAADSALAQRLASILGTARFRLYPSDDPTGCQIGGAAKNVMAIAAGAADGAALGENARAGLITRGLAEIARFAVASGGRADTVYGLSGAGDLVLTCTGTASRNYSLGVALGRGRALADILAERDTVAEGVATAPMLAARARALGCEMPIASVVSSLVQGEIDVPAACHALLSRKVEKE